MGTLLQDLRYGFRMLLRSPGLTLVAVMALALGIGANSALFSVVNSILLRPLPFKDPETLARLYEENREHNFLRQSATAPNFYDWREQAASFEGLAAYNNGVANLTGRDEPQRIPFAAVSADFFSVLGVEPVIGRTFTPDEVKPNGPDLIVLSYGFWQRYYGGSREALGQSLSLDGVGYTVIGVMPPEAQLPELAQLWGPLRVDFSQGRRSQFLSVIGRLKPGVTLEQAQAEMATIGERLAHEYPGPNKGWGVEVVRLNDVVVGAIRPALMVLFGAVGFVLLIACANVANLLLSRAAAREKEIAIRTALGARRLRIIRQLLTESLLLSVTGGGLGLLLALWATDLLIAMTSGIPRAGEVSVDGRVLGFTLLIALATGLIFGLAPALQASRLSLNESLKEGGRRSAGGAGSQRLRSLLVVSEVALALVLLIGAGLMVRTFRTLQEIEPGFNPDRVLTMRLSMSRTRYPNPIDRARFAEQVLSRVAALPGVESASAVANLPLSGGGWSNSFTVEGRPPLPEGEFIVADNNRATPDYFATMRIPLLKGRLLTDRDTADSPPVAVISEAMARRFFADEDPLGKRLNVHDGGPAREIVGVVGDVRQDGLDIEIRPMMYMPLAQNATRSISLAVRTASDPYSLTQAIKSEIWSADKDQSIDNIQSLDKMVSSAIA